MVVSTTIPTVWELGRMWVSTHNVPALVWAHFSGKGLEKISAGMEQWENGARQMQPHLFGAVENGWMGWNQETNAFTNSVTISHSSDMETPAELHPIHSSDLSSTSRQERKGRFLLDFLNPVHMLLCMSTACWLWHFRALNVYGLEQQKGQNSPGSREPT